jgi:hypothetical protein
LALWLPRRLGHVGSLAILAVGTGSAAVSARRTWRPILDFVAEMEASGQHTAFHARIAGPILNVLAGSVEFVRATPTTHHFILIVDSE